MNTLYTNDNNPATLKILIASYLAKKEINLKVVQLNGNIFPNLGACCIILPLLKIFR